MAKTAVAPYKRRKQYSPGFVIWTIIKYASLIFFAFMAVLPIVSCVITAFKTDAEYKSSVHSWHMY